jgi:hypothetical protein
MFEKSQCKFLLVPLSLLLYWLTGVPAHALPGQSTEEVAAWIQANPTLGPSSGNKLLVQRSDTAALRYTFQASVLPPGQAEFTKDHGKIRTERISMYDGVNGITLVRLQQSLRMIYGLDIYQDYNRAPVIYQYPSQSTINAARIAKTPLREALQGELRVGTRYAYWVEVAQPKTGKAVTGQMTVLLKSDLDKLETELRNR